MFAQVQIYPPGQEGYCHMAITIPYKLDRKKKQIAEIIHIGEVKPPYVPAKLRENTSMRFRVTVRKLNVMGRTDGGHCNISRPGPSARWEIIK